MLKEKGAPRGEVFPYKLYCFEIFKTFLVVDDLAESHLSEWDGAGGKIVDKCCPADFIRMEHLSTNTELQKLIWLFIRP